VVDLVLVAGKLEDYRGEQAEQGLALGGREPGRGVVQYAPAASSGLARQALATLSTGEGDGAPVPGWGAGHQAAALEPVGRTVALWLSPRARESLLIEIPGSAITRLSAAASVGSMR
jgi:hypothetical protein